MTRFTVLKVLGVAATILLVLVVAEITVVNQRASLSVSTSFSATAQVRLGIGTEANTQPINLSSVVFGYLLIIVSCLLRGFGSKWDRLIAGLSVIAVLGYLGELGRAFGLWQSELVLSFPLLVVILEWIQVSRFSRMLKYGDADPSTPA